MVCTALWSVLLYDLYGSPNNIRVIKSRKMRWARHVARMGEMGGAYRGLVGRLDGKKPTGRYGRIILKTISKKWEGHGLDWYGSGWGEAVGFCERGNERSGWIKCGILTTSLRIICCQEGLCSIELVIWLLVGWLVCHFFPLRSK